MVGLSDEVAVYLHKSDAGGQESMVLYCWCSEILQLVREERNDHDYRVITSGEKGAEYSPQSSTIVM